MNICNLFSKVLQCKKKVLLFDGSEDDEPETAKSSANPKDQGIGEITHVVREDQAKYRTRADEIREAFAKIREGLDLLEELMKRNYP